MSRPPAATRKGNRWSCTALTKCGFKLVALATATRLTPRIPAPQPPGERPRGSPQMTSALLRALPPLSALGTAPSPTLDLEPAKPHVRLPERVERRRSGAPSPCPAMRLPAQSVSQVRSDPADETSACALHWSATKVFPTLSSPGWGSERGWTGRRTADRVHQDEDGQVLLDIPPDLRR